MRHTHRSGGNDALSGMVVPNAGVGSLQDLLVRMCAQGNPTILTRWSGFASGAWIGAAAFEARVAAERPGDLVRSCIDAGSRLRDTVYYAPRHGVASG